MARRTSQTSFAELVSAARAYIPDLSVTTDLIVGFPGETAAEFGESLAYVQEIGFARLHVFSYSARPGTAAAKMPGQISKEVKRERTRRMIALGQELAIAFHRGYEGQVMDVLWESAVGADEGGLRWVGYTDNYLRVTANGAADLHNQVAPTRLFDGRAEGLCGSILPPEYDTKE
jgi:threonylcarbamoyladenosine tRNA methylthiotransferase MtaB